MIKVLYLLVIILSFAGISIGVYKVSQFYANRIETNLIKDAVLQDHTGQSWQISRLKENIGIIYFGYTSCPDICPNALNNLSITLADMGKEREIFQPIFVSVDPDRDTPDIIKSYIGNFDSSIIGLTGTEAQLKAFSWFFGASYSLRKSENQIRDYVVDHSANFFLVTSAGNYVMLPVKDNWDDLKALLLRSTNRIVQQN